LPLDLHHEDRPHVGRPPFLSQTSLANRYRAGAEGAAVCGPAFAGGDIWGEESEERKAKGEIMYRAYVEHGYRMVEIAEYLGVHYATISRAIRRGEKLGTRNATM